jgi:hypothetical protein
MPDKRQKNALAKQYDALDDIPLFMSVANKNGRKEVKSRISS